MKRKAKKVWVVRSQPNGNLGLLKSKHRKRKIARGEGRGGGWLGRVTSRETLARLKPKNSKKESAGCWECNQPGEFGAVEISKTEKQRKRAGWEESQPGKFRLGKTPKSKSKESAGVMEATN